MFKIWFLCGGHRFGSYSSIVFNLEMIPSSVLMKFQTHYLLYFESTKISWTLAIFYVVEEI